MRDLSALRQAIDALDAQLLQLLNQRAALAQEVGQWKAAQGDTVFYRPERERQVLERVAAHNPGPLSDNEVKRLFREIMSSCLALEQPLQIAFLGPEATFSHLAAQRQFGGAAQFQAQNSIEAVFQAVQQGRCDYGVLPIENSQEGTVHQTLDGLLHCYLPICGEINVRIEHQLLSLCPQLELIQNVYAHPQALAQCRSWLRLHLPQATLHPCNSNAEGVLQALQDKQGAAIAAEIASQHYQIPIVQRQIEDNAQNTTRFIVIGREEALPSGQDKTSMVLGAVNQAGALLNLLQPLQELGVNMCKIQSRPSKEALWEYVFFIDLEGHQRDARVAEALQRLQQEARLFRVLGSYPRAL